MTTSPSDDALPLETALQNGAFVVTRVLARGGFGITYLARNTALQRDVALKEFFPANCTRCNGRIETNGAVADYDAARAAFSDEARALAKFRHPGIVAVDAVFEENGTSYLAMEFLRGVTLRATLEEHGIFAETRALELAQHLARALEAVHGAGLLHLDIKPDNVMLCDDGRTVLLDFGLTREISRDAFATTRLTSNVRCGTPGYAPLEQYGQSIPLTPAADIYALCATLYETLGGKTPPEAVERAAGAPLSDLRVLASACSSFFIAAIEAGLRLDAKRRPQSAAAFLNLLQLPPRAAPRSVFPAQLQAEEEDDDDDQSSAIRHRDSSEDDGTFAIVALVLVGFFLIIVYLFLFK